MHEFPRGRAMERHCRRYNPLRPGSASKVAQVGERCRGIWGFPCQRDRSFFECDSLHLRSPLSCSSYKRCLETKITVQGVVSKGNIGATLHPAARTSATLSLGKGDGECGASNSLLRHQSWTPLRPSQGRRGRGMRVGSQECPARPCADPVWSSTPPIET